MTQLRVVAAERRRTDNKPDPASSILKIKGSEIQQATTELLLEVVGPYAMPISPSTARTSAGTSRRSAPNGLARSRRPISTGARRRSMAAPTRSKRTSSPRQFLGACERNDGTDGLIDGFRREEQRLLKESLDRLIGDRYAFEQRKTYGQSPEGWSRELWGQYAELGLLGLPFAESYGGSAAARSRR